MLQMINNLFTMSGSGSCYGRCPGQGKAMHEPGDTTLKQKARITVGALTALVIVGFLAVIALALMAS